MKFDIVFDPRVVEDVLLAFTYYENQQKGLGNKFEEVVSKYLEHLQEMPYHSVRYKSIRTLPLKPFPFMIHYTLNAKKKVVKVHGIIHTSMDPKKGWV